MYPFDCLIASIICIKLNNYICEGYNNLLVFISKSSLFFYTIILFCNLFNFLNLRFRFDRVLPGIIHIKMPFYKSSSLYFYNV